MGRALQDKALYTPHVDVKVTDTLTIPVPDQRIEYAFRNELKSYAELKANVARARMCEDTPPSDIPAVITPMMVVTVFFKVYVVMPFIQTFGWTLTKVWARATRVAMENFMYGFGRVVGSLFFKSFK